MTTPEKKTNELVDELLKGCTSPKEILGEQGLLKQLSKRLVERQGCSML
jgi:putative transposase